MLKNYFKSTLRDAYNNKLYWILNSFGLAIGAAVSLLVYQYVSYEHSYDQFYDQANEIFRIQVNQEDPDGSGSSTINTTDPLSAAIRGEVPQIELVGTVQPVTASIEVGENEIKENRLHFAENDLLKIFEFEFLEGGVEGQFDAPQKIVLTKTLAEKIFGTHLQLTGKVLKINTQYQGQFSAVVSGVIKDLPGNSHFHSEGFISMATLNRLYSPYILPQLTYVRSQANADVNLINQSLTAVANKYSFNPNGFSRKKVVGFELFPVSEIHLSSDPVQGGRGSKKVITTFLIFGLLIQLIACTNYMNLSAARYSQKVRQIGIRKVIGAQKKQVFGLILTESLIISGFALLIGGLLAEFGSMVFKNIIDKPINIGFIQSPRLFIQFSGFTLLVGIISGTYPAFQFSKIKISQAIKGRFSKGKGGTILRRTLVLFQFIVSGGLIISTLVIYIQMRYVSQKDLGFNKENIVIVELPKDPTKAELFQNQLSLDPGIAGLATSTAPLGLWGNKRKLELINQAGEHIELNSSYSQIDPEFLNLMEFGLVEGQDFNQQNEIDQKGVWVNQTLVNQMNWKDPLSQTIGLFNYQTQQYDQRLPVLGVIRDFNLLSLYNPIDPFVFFHRSAFQSGQRHLVIKLIPSQSQRTEIMNRIQDIYYETETTDAYSGFILEDRIQEVYAPEQVRAKIYLALTTLSILVACLGLFGLAFFSVKVRTQEIAIRKVLGSSLTGIVKLLSKEFVIIVIIASTLAFPIATLLMTNWLQTFAYRITIGPGIFITAILATASIAFSSVIYQGLTTAKINPAQTLKTE